MNQFYLSDKYGELASSIKLEGNFVIAYSLRLWKSDDKVLNLMEELRGSCFNSLKKEIKYINNAIIEPEFDYIMELDANISTISPSTKFSLNLDITHHPNNGDLQFLGNDKITGEVKCNTGGKFVKLAVVLTQNQFNSMVG